MPWLGLVLGLGIALAVTADDDAYRRGIEALDRRDWAAAAQAMEEALADRPRPGGDRVKIYGMRFEDYTPYYHLGVARSELGDCAGALEAWARSEAAGVLRKSDARDLEERRAACEERMRRSPPRPSTASDDSSQEASTAAGPRPPGDATPPAPPDPGSPWTGDPPPEPLRLAAADFLAHRYGQALDRLEGFTAEDPRARATAHLLRAACRHALYRLSGQDDPEAEAAAGAEIVAGRALAPDLEPSAFWFSPSFRRLFDRYPPS